MPSASNVTERSEHDLGALLHADLLKPDMPPAVRSSADAAPCLQLPVLVHNKNLVCPGQNWPL